MTSERWGGIDGFIDQFREAGLDQVIGSWIGGKEGRALTPSQVESALGASGLDGLAARSGLSREAVTSVLTFLLPRLIALLTPDGVLPSSHSLRSQFSGYIAGSAGLPAAPRVEHRAGGRSSHWTLGAAAAVLAALAGFLWMGAPAGTVNPQLTVSNNDSRITSSGGIRDGATLTSTPLGNVPADAARVAGDRAPSAIGTSGAPADEPVQAMNLAIINFPSGSAELPADTLESIEASAEAIRRAPPGSTIEIGGHTDNIGDPASNLALSQARADVVKGALVSDGVPALMLSTRGYGDTRPRAPNDTEFGRFQNRRNEYTVVQ
jgi:outer membrane protein OmpA-like peptidoglycan-associated protein